MKTSGMTEIVVTREFTPSVQTFMAVMSQQVRLERKGWAPKLATPVFLVTFGLLMFGDWRSGELLSSGGVLSILAGCVVAAAIVFVLLWSLPRLVVKHSANKHGFTRRRYTFTPDTLSLETTDGVTLTAPYRTFTKVSLGPDYLLLWESLPASAAHIIPCSEFESKEHEKIVRDWLVPFAVHPSGNRAGSGGG